MVSPAERHRELIAHLAAERPDLGEAQVMRVARPPPTNEAGWWTKAGIDAVSIARKLWNETRSAGFPAPPANVQPTAAGAPSASVATKARTGRRTRKGATPGTADAAPNRA